MRIRSFHVAVSVLALLPLCAFPQDPQTDSSRGNNWKDIEMAMGRSGQILPDGVIKFGLPRKDLHITLQGVQLKPALALGSWVAFKRDKDAAMVMGDLVLTEDELQPVMSKLQENGIQESAVHNHLVGESPRVLYMHIASRGDALHMARALHDAVALTKTPAPDTASSAPASDLGFDQRTVEAAMGHAGKINGGVLQFSFPRSEQIADSGMVVPASMGIATAINFQSTGGGKAAVTGDFVLLSTEVNAVIKTLRQNGIDVTALHSHMLTEEPRLFFMHFWANDDATRLAKGLRAALDQTKSAK